jgi:LasA protease
MAYLFSGCSDAPPSPPTEMEPSRTIRVSSPGPRPTTSSTPQPITTQSPTPSTTPSSSSLEDPNGLVPGPGYTLYTAQPGDTLAVVARRFGVEPADIASSMKITPQSLIKIGQELNIPELLTEDENMLGPSEILLPDTEIVNSRSALDFDMLDYIQSEDGYFSNYREYLKLSGWYSGAEIVARVASENAINPRLLIALLEFQSNWISSASVDDETLEYPLRYSHPNETGLYRQLTWAAGQISQGYYGWRDGSFMEINFADDFTIHLAPNLNAGSAALQALFSNLYPHEEWEDALYSERGFISQYSQMFGSFSERDQLYGPIYTHELTQPSFLLPFQPGIPWNFTSGPHPPWRLTGALAALDFAPSGISDCEPNNEWVTAVASGLVVRSGNGVVALDLDKDGYQQTGWVVVYIHLSSEDRVEIDSMVHTGSPIGHPSCEGGLSTGSHVHIARMYNGEWIPAGGPVPFNLGGWVAKNGEEPYQGYLVKKGQTIAANRFSTHESQIIWSLPDPAAHNEDDMINP